MTMAAPWHAGPDLLRQYADGRLDPVAQAAVETHVERCPECRAATTALVTPAALAPVWDRVLVEVRSPEPSSLSRVLRRIGVPEVDLVVLRSSVNLVVGFAIAVAASMAFTLAAGQFSADRQRLLWLALAPLLPAILVAAAYDTTDPLRELEAPTPYSKLRVALLRTVVSVAGAVPLVLVMGLVPDVGVSLVTWLLPALALTLVLLVLLTRLSAVVSIGAVSITWVLGVAVLRAGDQSSAVTAPVGQSISLAVALAAAALLAREAGLLQTVRSRS